MEHTTVLLEGASKHIPNQWTNSHFNRFDKINIDKLSKTVKEMLISIE